ncbi:hypothetical protein [Allokutzneria albata]|uniref:hypothetical protein n=1 Tax=Allokutzneria albata TaxID=211114 RepID=UPI0004C3AF7D|nr:hypothetical protein [Allokutzneria albata]
MAELTSAAPDSCGNVAWPDACPPPRGNSVVLRAMDPGGIGHPGGVEWPGSAGATLASSRPPLTGPGVEWPMP